MAQLLPHLLSFPEQPAQVICVHPIIICFLFSWECHRFLWDKDRNCYRLRKKYILAKCIDTSCPVHWSRVSDWIINGSRLEKTWLCCNEQQRCRPSYTFAQSNQCLCGLLSEKYNDSTCYTQYFNTLASLCSWVDCARGYKTFFVLNSTEHEFSTAHQNKNGEK